MASEVGVIWAGHTNGFNDIIIQIIICVEREDVASMEFVTITEEELDRYRSLIPADISEHIGRSCCRALEAHPDGGEPSAVLIWKQENQTDDARAAAELIWFYAADVDSGRELLEEFEHRCRLNGVERVNFEFSGELCGRDAGLEALQAAGYDCREAQSRDLLVTVADFKALPITARPKEYPNVASLGTLNLNQMRKGVERCIYRRRTGMLPDLYTLPFGWFEPELSCCVKLEEKICGFLLVHTQSSGGLSVELLDASEPAGKQEVLGMIRHAITCLVRDYPDDTRVLIHRCSDETRGLTDRLFPGKTGEPVIAGNKLLTGTADAVGEEGF